MDTPQHDQAWPGLMAPHLPLPTQDLSTPGGQASSVTMPSPAPPRQASAPGLKPPPSSAPKSTVSLFWVTTRHTQGISISACGASDSLRLLRTPSGSVPPTSAPWAAPHTHPGPLGSFKLILASTTWKSSQPLTHWPPQGPPTAILCTETPAPGTHAGAALG